MLRRNLVCADHVLTVSESSRRSILERYGLSPERVSVVYNTIDREFGGADADETAVAAIRSQFAGRRLLLYSGGADWRKNIGRLVKAFAYLISAGEPVTLLATGGECGIWKRELTNTTAEARCQVRFVGHLTIMDLKAHYLAADAVVYPSLCEGFGRVCLESMAVGTPVACSDIEVLHELCGDYAVYFDPKDPADIARAIRLAFARGRGLVRQDARFAQERVVSSFVSVMDRFLPC
jgi:glycosyltransferase involved in cell wall biosynthesis